MENKNILNLQISWPKRILLGLAATLGSLTLALTSYLVQESDDVQSLKGAKVIDKFLAMLSTSPKVTIPVLVFALFILSVFLNIVLFKRMRLYFKACNEFGNLFYKSALKLSKISKQPVKVQLNSKEITINYNSLEKDKKL